MKLRDLIPPSPETQTQADLLYHVSAMRNEREEGMARSWAKVKVPKPKKVKPEKPFVAQYKGSKKGGDKERTGWYWLDTLEIMHGPDKTKAIAIERAMKCDSQPK